MKSFGQYITKHLFSFLGVVILLLLLNILAFGWTFYGIMKNDYGDLSPQAMLEKSAAAASVNGISKDIAELLKSNQIWAVYLDIEGNTVWRLDAPSSIPDHVTVQDVAVFAKGYLADYPVFIWNNEDGMLILGYPKESYMKITGNYLSIRFVQTIPFFIAGILAADFFILFLTYFLSKRKILRSTEPIIASVESLSNGKPVMLAIDGELAEVANSVNQVSHILSKQNEARANWISGISHDIRTPLSMIMGYAGRIAAEGDGRIREEAEIISRHSVKIKELIQDLNLVSRLEYEMQPIHQSPVHLAGLLRSFAADLLNTGLTEQYPLVLEISNTAEAVVFNCDERLMTRAVHNLVQNSIRHNPNGCTITLRLACIENHMILSIADNGIGVSDEKLKELQELPHYMNSTDERLDLRHGLGILLVRQIVAAHHGSVQIESKLHSGYQTILSFPQKNTAAR